MSKIPFRAKSLLVAYIQKIFGGKSNIININGVNTISYTGVTMYGVTYRPVVGAQAEGTLLDVVGDFTITPTTDIINTSQYGVFVRDIVYNIILCVDKNYNDLQSREASPFDLMYLFQTAGIIGVANVTFGDVEYYGTDAETDSIRLASFQMTVRVQDTYI